MKAMHLIKTFLLLALVASISVRCSCEKTVVTPTPTAAGTLASVRWKVAKATKDGVTETQANYAAFRIQFSVVEADGGTYTFARGGAPFSPSRQSSVGTWTLTTAAPTDLKFDAKSTAFARSITLSNVTASKNMTMTWKTEADLDKTTPTIVFDLIPE